MINLAIVEDEEPAQKTLSGYLAQYGKDRGVAINVSVFGSANPFLDAAHAGFDVVLMDIMLPDLNGMEAAKELRRFDKKAIIIFVTNMAQFAVGGYEVQALDFIVKPVSYHDFALKMDRAARLVEENRDATVAIGTRTATYYVPASSIYYVEVSGHELTYHTSEGNRTSYGTLGKLEADLRKNHFLRCNDCYLVNPRHIEKIDGFDVRMRNGDVLRISRLKRKQFLAEVARWLGEGNNP
jgi:DNA-binding LytR/AlgR family response regulator